MSQTHKVRSYFMDFLKIKGFLYAQNIYIPINI